MTTYTFNYDEQKRAYMEAANCLFMTYDNFEMALAYFKQAEKTIAPFDERHLILESIRELRKECEELEEKTQYIYSILTGR